MIRRFAAVAVLSVAAVSHAQEAPYKLVMEYDRPGLTVPHWQIVVPEQGMAQYTGAPVKGSDPGVVSFRISAAGRSKLGGMLAASKGLAPCETKSKGLANMGMKRVEYTPAGGAAVQCVFNYTDNKALSEASGFVMALAATIQTGLELERLHRYDRLGLDAVMVRLVDDVKEGRAVEITAIRPTLESLVNDSALLERVRTRAQQLLDLAQQQESAAP